MILSLVPALAGIFAKSGITLDPIAKPLAAVLAFFYSLVPNYAFSIVLLTVAMMIVLTPLTIKQTRSMLVMQKLQPQMKRLQETHKNDRQALNEAVMALYKEHNASPLGGCLPMLLPLPVFFALFRVLEGLSRQVNGKSVPKYLTAHTRMFIDIQRAGGQLDSFGMNLAKSATNVGGSFGHKLPYLLLLLAMVGTQYYQQRQLTSRNSQAAAAPGAAMMKFFPLVFGVISIRFPAGLVLYWTVSNLIRILQQWAMYRYDPKVKALVEQDIKEIEARTREIGADKTPKPRLRDLLAQPPPKNGDTKNQGGKGAAGPGGKTGGSAKGSNAGKSGRPPASTGKTPPAGSGSGAAKPAVSGWAALKERARQGSQGGAGGNRPAPSKGAGGNRPAPSKGAGGNGASPSKPAAPPAAKAGKAPGRGAGGPGSGKGQGGGGAGGTAAKPKAAGSGGGPKPAAGGGAGASKDTAAAAPNAKPAAPTGNGTGGAASGGRTGAGKGRTGGNSSRNVSSARRRRRGR